MNARIIPVIDKICDPLTTVLDIWVRWSRKDDMASTHRDRAGDHDEEDEPYLKADIKTAEAVHVMVFELRPVHRWAIQKRCGVSTVWRYPNADYSAVLSEAEEIITTKMKKNYATCKYFA